MKEEIRCPCKKGELICCYCHKLLCFSYDEMCIMMMHVSVERRKFCPQCYAQIRKETKEVLEQIQEVK